MRKKNISILSDCYGCGVCTMVCPVHIIDLKENERGFLSPDIIKQSECIECGLCLRVCGFNNDLINDVYDERFYIGWSENSVARHQSSSGGIAREIIEYGIKNEFNICAAVYNHDSRRVEHINGATVENLHLFIGSKYLLSRTQEAFKSLNLKARNIVIGTPCQIDSFRRLLRMKRCEVNFILVDFFCHGVPSAILWDKYLRHVESFVGDIKTISWRNKDDGWKKSYCIKATGTRGEYMSSARDGDLFYKFFLGNYCLNQCCYDSCKYKQSNSSADIRIGDCWGISGIDEKDGISCIVAFSSRGDALLSQITSTCHIERVKRDTVIKGQMKECAPKPCVHPYVVNALSTTLSIKEIYKRYIRPFEIFIIYPKRIWRKIKSML